jgi:cytochrome d ubiquinol oxidase subunit I
MLSMTLWLVTVLVPLQIVLGDLHGVNTFEHQPTKLAAMEANWETQRRMPAILFAWPDEKAEKNLYEIAIPAVGSLYLTHSVDGEVKGLKEWPPEDRPPVAIVFFSFRAMVGIGLLMLAVVIASLWLRWRERLYDSRAFHLVCVAASPLGFLAVVSGWITTEVGRQPWVVQGLMRTRDGISPSLTGNDVLASLIAYIIVYLIVFGAGLLIMLRLMRAGPATAEPEEDPSLRSNRPLGAITRRAREAAQ